MDLSDGLAVGHRRADVWLGSQVFVNVARQLGHPRLLLGVRCFGAFLLLQFFSGSRQNLVFRYAGKQRRALGFVGSGSLFGGHRHLWLGERQ